MTTGAMAAKTRAGAPRAPTPAACQRSSKRGMPASGAVAAKSRMAARASHATRAGVVVSHDRAPERTTAVNVRGLLSSSGSVLN